ncbi:hypothetical protein LQW54_000943 [Pestalotiopsis sp. IQ-011]
MARTRVEDYVNAGVRDAQVKSEHGWHFGPIPNANEGWIPARQAAAQKTGQAVPPISSSDNVDETRPYDAENLSQLNAEVCCVGLDISGTMCGTVLKGQPGRNARFVKEPGRGLPGGKLDEYATDLERLARKSPDFAAKWGTCFHRHAVHTEMQGNARWWPHLPLKLRPAPRSPTPEHFRRPLIEPPKVPESTADTDAPTVAGKRQVEGVGRPLINPPNVSRPNSDSRTPVVAVQRRAEGRGRPLIEPAKVPETEPDSDTPIVVRPRQASGRGRPREESCVVVNPDPYRRNLPRGGELGRATLSPRPEQRSGHAAKPGPNSDSPTTARPRQAIGRGLVARRGRPSTSRGASNGTGREQPRLPSQPTAPSSRKRMRDSSHGRRDDPADGTTASRAIVLGSSPPPQAASDSASATTSSGGSWCDF